MQKTLQSKFYNKFDVWLIQQYGSSETGSLALSDFGDEFDVIGRPLNGVKFLIKIKDNTKHSILVSTKYTIGSYIVKGKLLKLNKDWFEMGDIGKIREDGKLLIYGRSDDIIIKGGEKISIENVTKIIKMMPEIDDVFIYQSENVLQEIVCNYSSCEDISNEKFLNHCNKYMSKYQIPSQFMRVDKINKRRDYSWKKNVE